LSIQLIDLIGVLIGFEFILRITDYLYTRKNPRTRNYKKNKHNQQKNKKNRKKIKTH